MTTTEAESTLTSPPFRASDGPGELLVAAASRDCVSKQCAEQCCDDCGHVVWKLASDPATQVVPQGVVLPNPPASECSLHYDLRAPGEKEADRFVVRAARAVPSERGRRPGTSARLELVADGGSCTVMACETECCNMCDAISWVPKTTFDAVKWTGDVHLPQGGMDCDVAAARVVTGTWLGPSEFEIRSLRVLSVKTSR